MALSPFDPFAAVGDGDPVDPSRLPGAKGTLAVIERALAPAGLFAPAIRKMEWWEVGVALGADIGAAPPRIVTPDEARHEPPPRPGESSRLMSVDD